MDNHWINGTVLDLHDFLWEGALGEASLSSLVGSTAIRRLTYLCVVLALYGYKRTGGAGGVDEGSTGVLVTTIFVSFTMGASNDFGSFLRYDVEPNKGSEGLVWEIIASIDLALGANWIDGVWRSLLVEIQRVAAKEVQAKVDLN